MKTLLFRGDDIGFSEHPKFTGVRFAALVAAKDNPAVSVSFLEIPPGTAVPRHTHDPQVDSILIVGGSGEAWVNGAWQTVGPGDYVFVPASVEHGIRNTGTEILRLFVHHGPPLF